MYLERLFWPFIFLSRALDNILTRYVIVFGAFFTADKGKVKVPLNPSREQTYGKHCGRKLIWHEEKYERPLSRM